MHQRVNGFTRIIASVCSLLAASVSHNASGTEGPAFNRWADKAIDRFREKYNLASVTAAIVFDGDIVWTGSTGYANIEARRPATPETPYRIASLTKSMTGVAVIKLVENKKIDLTATVQAYVPRFPEKRWPITVGQLLHHTAGIGHYRARENRPTEHFETLTDALTVFQGRPLRFEPGTRYGYTTYGYTLLGSVIEGATGMEYERWMKTNLWRPSGMLATQLENRNRPIDCQASLYRLKRKKLVPDTATDLSVKGPGGGVVSTAPDMARFAQAVMSGELLNEDSIKQLWTVPDSHDGPSYAAGWFVDHDHELGYVAMNDGNQSGANSRLILLPQRQLAVVVLCNVSRVGRPMQQFTWSLVREFVSP